MKDLAREVDLDLDLARRTLALLRDEGRAYRATSEMYFDANAITACKERIAKFLNGGGEGSAANLKEAMGQGVTRKFAMPLLEAFDADGFTVRTGDVRTLRE